MTGKYWASEEHLRMMDRRARRGCAVQYEVQRWAQAVDRHMATANPLDTDSVRRALIAAR